MSALFGAAHAPSPDARCGHPVLRSLECRLRFGILPALVSNAGSRGMGTPSRILVARAIHDEPQEMRGATDARVVAADQAFADLRERGVVGSEKRKQQVAEIGLDLGLVLRRAWFCDVGGTIAAAFTSPSAPIS